MHYQYVRFNVYPSDGAPVQEELWLQLHFHYNDAALKNYLADRFKTAVTLIKSAVITSAQYADRSVIR